MVGKLGWTMGRQCRHQIRDCDSSPNQKLKLKHFLTGTMMHIEKENFKWTIVGFVLTEKRDPDWGHFKTILTMLVSVGRASIKQKMSKAVLHFYTSVNSMFWAVKEGNGWASATGAYQTGPDPTQTNAAFWNLSCELCTWLSFYMSQPVVWTSQCKAISLSVPPSLLHPTPTSFPP